MELNLHFRSFRSFDVTVVLLASIKKFFASMQTIAAKSASSVVQGTKLKLLRQVEDSMGQVVVELTILRYPGGSGIKG